MIRNDLSASVPGIPSTETFGAGAPATFIPDPSLPTQSSADPGDRPTVLIKRRRHGHSGSSLRKADSNTSRPHFVFGKNRGLFLRIGMNRIRWRAGRVRVARMRKPSPAARKPRRWEPVIISPTFPRGPLALPNLGFLHEGARPRPRQARRPRTRNRAEQHSRADRTGGNAKGGEQPFHRERVNGCRASRTGSWLRRALGAFQAA